MIEPEIMALVEALADKAAREYLARVAAGTEPPWSEEDEAAAEAEACRRAAEAQPIDRKAVTFVAGPEIDTSHLQSPLRVQL
jgi:hypothetical protein